MVKVCLVTHFFPPHTGGIEKVASEQSKRLADLGYEFSVLTSNTSGCTQETEGVKIYTYPTFNLIEGAGIPYPLLSITAYKTFSKIIKTCDIVHAHGHPYLSSYLAFRVAKKYDKPFVLTQHNTFIDYESWFNIVESINDIFIGKAVLKNADRIIVVSKKTKEYVVSLGADPAKINLMYNGVDTELYSPKDKERAREMLSLPKDKVLILTVRRLVYKNGLDTLIEATPHVLQQHKNTCFIIIGKGPNRDLIIKKAKELGVESEVKLTGFVQDSVLPLYYNAADYFTIPSNSGEGFPLVLLESMACGLPVVATSVGGMPEIIQTKNGVLVPPKDPIALANTILFLFKNPKFTNKIGREARKTVENGFTWKKNIDSLQKIYEEII